MRLKKSKNGFGIILENMYANTIITYYNRSIYAAQNDPLTIIRSDGIVAIVETCRGQRFPCLVEMLSEDMAVVVVEEVEVIITDQLRLF